MKTSASLLFRSVFVAAIAATAHAATPAATTRPGDTIIILDASGSMNERIRGETKIAIARRAVRELIASLPATTRIGLVAYSHRRNTCEDIELLIPPGPLDQAAFIKAVDALEPNGRTPLSAALEFTAAALDHTKTKASIILVSDGLETCGGDPCATADQLAQTGAGLTIHAVAFDLSAKEARSFECIATATKGRFLQANDAATLKDALVVAVAEATVPVKSQPPAEVLTAATLQAPAEVPAGADFVVEWNGPNNPGDYITIVPKGATDDTYVNTAYTRQGSPLNLTALVDDGDAEIRYVAARSRKILGRAAIKVTKIEVTLTAPDEAIAGSPVPVVWTGPKNHGDYLTIVPKNAADGAYVQWADVAKGSPLNIAAPIDAGDAEIRYLSGQGRKVLARRALKVIAAVITLDAPTEVVAGAEVTVAWTGPNNADDFLTIAPQGTPEGGWSRTFGTRLGSPARLIAPIDAGEAEIRYYSGQAKKVLARRAIKVVSSVITLDASAEVVAGAEVAIVWTGPNNPNDFLTIMPKGASDGAWNRTTYTRQGSPARLAAPIEAGEAEIRYLSGEAHKVLARRAIKVVAAVITLDAPAEAVAGSTVSVTWTGPNNAGDFLVIVAKGAPDGSWSRTTPTRQGSPTSVAALTASGDAELRYISGQNHKVLARRPIRIVAATAP